MKISALINQLTELRHKHGDITVMCSSPDSEEPYEVSSLYAEEAGEGEFPDDWNMPDGFKYVLLT